MKITQIVIIAAAAVCLLGCNQGFHDPLLRQQLTTMVSGLDDKNQKTVDQWEKDIRAILSVNAAKMGEEQKKKLSLAQDKLMVLSSDLLFRDIEKQLHPDWNNKSNSKGVLGKELLSEIEELVSEAKKAISEVAATL